MTTRAEITARIKSDIADINTVKGIKKEKVARVLTDLVNLASPSSESGRPVEMGLLDGYPLYRKLFLVPDGNDLDAVDLSLPANHSLVNITSVKDTMKQLHIEAGFISKNGEITGRPLITFAGANNEFIINDEEVDSATLEFRFNRGEITTLEYNKGVDLIVPSSSIIGYEYLTQVKFSNVVGATVRQFGAPNAYNFKITIDSQVYDIPNENMTGSNILYWPGVHPLPPEYLQPWIQTYKADEVQFCLNTINLGENPARQAVDGSIDLELTFPDSTTEILHIDFNQAPVYTDIATDISAFQDVSLVSVKILPTSVFTTHNDPVNIGINLPLSLEVNLDKTVHPDSYIAQLFSVATKEIKNQTLGFITSIFGNVLQKDPLATNIAISVEYIDLTEIP